MSSMYWDWDERTGFRELVVDLTIHNDLDTFFGEHGIYLMVVQGRISERTFYFGFQTDVADPVTWRSRGKGVIFNRWGTRDLANVRLAEDGYSQSSGHEGNFVGTRRGYDWGAGAYRLRLAPEGADSDGEWFGLSVTELASGATTWIGALKFPYPDRGLRATINPHSYSTIEIYGSRPIRSIDIPEFSVSIEPPKGDGRSATHGATVYSLRLGQILNTEARFDHTTGTVFLQAGGLTRRKTEPGKIRF